MRAEDSTEAMQGVDMVELAPAPPRGLRQPVQFETVRVLNESDLPALRAPLPPSIQPQETKTLTQLRHSHHQCARLIALGRPAIEVSLICGYSVGYIGQLQKDPTFSELIDFYSKKTDEVMVDVAKRMKEFGLSALEELQERLAREPEKWSKAELMQLLELMYGKGGAAKSSGLGTSNTNGGGVNISVNFIKSSEAPNDPPPMLDVTPAP